MKYNKFFCEIIPKGNGNIESIQSGFDKPLRYASMGRFGIFHILRAIKQNRDLGEKVLMPVYACESIAWAIKKAGFVPIYYDISSEDLNGNLENIKIVAERNNCKILILPSLYGNPANLIETEDYCNKSDIFLIDDAAQSFGSSLCNKMVGSFGNSGLFSFSAGKPTFGHLGCFFWLDLDYHFKRTNHYLYHKLGYLNFFYNRYGDYNSKHLYRSRILNYILIALYKIFNIANDDICKFEQPLLAKIAQGNMKELRVRRAEIIERVKPMLSGSPYRLVEAVRGVPNNNKIVLVAKNEGLANNFINFLKSNNLYCSHGYSLLDKHVDKYPVAAQLYKCVIEIPIVLNLERDLLTIECMKRYLEELR